MKPRRPRREVPQAPRPPRHGSDNRRLGPQAVALLGARPDLAIHPRQRATMPAQMLDEAIRWNA